MPPQQTPLPPQVPQQQNPYEFIFNDSAPKRSRFPLMGGSFKDKLILIGGAFVVIIVALFAWSAVFGGGTDPTQKLVGIAQEQNELIRISKIGAEKARLPATQNLAVTSIASISSSQQQVTAAIGKKAKISEKVLGAKQDPQSDKQLNEAALNNQFDPTFTKLYQTKIAAYQQNLKSAYDATNNKKTKEILQTAYKSASTLVGN